MSRTKPSAKRPIDERLAVANAILAALAEGGELGGEFTFDLIDEARDFTEAITTSAISQPTSRTTAGGLCPD